MISRYSLPSTCLSKYNVNFWDSTKCNSLIILCTEAHSLTSFYSMSHDKKVVSPSNRFSPLKHTSRKRKEQKSEKHIKNKIFRRVSPYRRTHQGIQRPRQHYRSLSNLGTLFWYSAFVQANFDSFGMFPHSFHILFHPNGRGGGWKRLL